MSRGLAIGDQAFTDVGGDVQCLSAPVQIVAVVGNAQARIDNGGLRYFLETDWVGNPPYSVFSDALRSIGANANANAIDAAVAELGFGNPERDVERRLRVLAGPRGARIERMERDYVDDVWQLLGEFIFKHKGDLFPRGTSPSLPRAKRRKG